MKLWLKRSAGLGVILAGVSMCAIGCAGGAASIVNTGGNSGGVPPPVLTVSMNSLPPGTTGQAYNYTFQVTGGTAPYTWSVISPNGLPSGLQLSTAGVLSGSTAFQGIYDTTYQAQDSSSPHGTGTISLSLTMVGVLTVQTTALFNGSIPPNVGANFSTQLAATGGVGSDSWGLLAGSGPLPPGLTLTSFNGEISGVPTVAGTYQFTVQVSNVGPPQQSATHTYSLTITNNLVILNSSVYLAVVTKPFQMSLQALGGQPPYA
jgi:hypothetical protein